jgi:glycosyltransferase involved in cell wall biosynthesis
MSRVGIFFFRPSLGGGTTTFTAHLFKALEAAGANVELYRVRERGEERLRQFGGYEGVMYRNIVPDEAKRIVKKIPTVMSAPAADKYLTEVGLIQKLMKRGMQIVVHDPNEFDIFDHLGTKLVGKRPICIRPTMQKFYKTAVWIPHPYMRVRKTDAIGGTELWDRRKNAVSIARIASVKRPKIILEAARLLPKKLRVELLGAEYRMYTRSLAERYSDVFEQSGKTFQFPMTFEAPVDLAGKYRFNVDMTWFPDDGGGTQYAQMEAMDAGTVNIMHRDWFRYPGELKADKHVLTVNGPKGLSNILRNWKEYVDAAVDIRTNSYKLLRQHAPAKIGKLYLEELNRE